MSYTFFFECGLFSCVSLVGIRRFLFRRYAINVEWGLASCVSSSGIRSSLNFVDVLSMYGYVRPLLSLGGCVDALYLLQRST